MRFQACSAIAMAVFASASANAEDDHNRLGRSFRRQSDATAPGVKSKFMSMPLPNQIDIWNDNEDFDYNEYNDEEGDDVIADIIGGDLLQRGDRPYLVSLGNEKDKKYTHACGGTLIASRVVLSAAHCFNDIFGEFSLTVSIIKINMYELNNNTDVISYPVCAQEYGTDCDRNTHAYALRHPRFRKNDTAFLDNDFILIFLPADVTSIQPVSLNSDPTFPSDGVEMEILGWGDTDKTGNLDLPNVPYTADVMVMSNDECTGCFNVGKGVISDNQICVRNEGKSTGLGDSGGPLIHKFPNGSSVQVGITSFGFVSDSGSNVGASVFSRVSSGIEWITSVVCGEIGLWCDMNEDGNNCFNATSVTSHFDHITSDYDVDLLPGFIEERIENGFSPLSNRAQRSRLDSSVSMSLKKNTNIFEGDFGVHNSTVRGAKATNSSLPYIVSIGLNYLENKTQVGHVCAGTLIQTNVILSSAHCFTDRYGHKIRLDWVDLAPKSSVSRFQIKKSNIWRHIKYNHTTGENDLALVFLDSKVDIKPVRLNDNSGNPLLPGVSVNVTGWGPKSQDGLYRDRQKTVTELYTPNSKCNYLGLTSDKMCTTSISDEVNDRCIGDSGSPVIVNMGREPVQVGVTSLNGCRPRPVVSPPCPNNTKLLTVSVLTDMFPQETSWTLTSVCSGRLEASVDKRTKYALQRKFYSDGYCVPDTQYKFTIFDADGDGMCCESGVGSYNVTFDGRLVASGGNFAFSNSTPPFGNPNGVCPLPLPNIHSRVSSGVEWIHKAIKCRLGTVDQPGKIKPGALITVHNEEERKKSAKAKAKKAP